MLKLDPFQRLSLRRILQQINNLQLTPKLNQKLLMSSTSTSEKLKILSEENDLKIFESGPVTCTAITKDNKTIVSGGFDGFLKIFSLESNTLQGNFKAHTAPVLCLKITTDDHLSISGGRDSLVAI